MLLDVVVARQPGEIEPVANLVLHLAPLGLAAAVPEVAGIVVLLDGDDVADRAVLNALHRLADAFLVPPAQPGDDGQLLFLRQLVRLDDRPIARRIDGDRLFDEAVLAAFDGVLECAGRKCGGVQSSTTSTSLRSISFL